MDLLVHSMNPHKSTTGNLPGLPSYLVCGHGACPETQFFSGVDFLKSVSQNLPKKVWWKVE